MAADYSRLPAHTVPCHYKVRLEPEFNTFGFKGQVDIIIEVTEPITTLVINASKLAVNDLKVKKSCVKMQGEDLSDENPSDQQAGSSILGQL